MYNQGQFAFVEPGNQQILPCFFVLPQLYYLDRSSLGKSIQDIVLHLVATYVDANGVSKVDTDRVILTGVSSGGGCAVNLANFSPDFYAALVPLSSTFTSVERLTDFPTWWFHSSNDQKVGIWSSDSMVRSLRQAGSNTIFTRYQTGGHGRACWDAAYHTRALVPWLAAQRRLLYPIAAPCEVRITSPTDQTHYQTNLPDIILSGVASHMSSPESSPSILRIEYANGDHGQWNKTVAGGTLLAWHTSPITLQSTGVNSIKVLALGKSWSVVNGGETQYSSTINVTCVP